MEIALIIGTVMIIFFLWIILLLKVRVTTFTALSLKELEEQINTFTEKHFFKDIQDVTIRDDGDQYYGYVRWRGFGLSEE